MDEEYSTLIIKSLVLITTVGDNVNTNRSNFYSSSSSQCILTYFTHNNELLDIDKSVLKFDTHRILYIYLDKCTPFSLNYYSDAISIK